MRKPVERQIGDPEHRLLRRALGPPARQRFDPGQQLGEGVGFREIVVAAGAQALHPVVHLAERGQDQDRRLVLLIAQRADQRQPVHLRQHAIDDGHVITAFDRHVVSGDAIVGEIDDMARLAKRLGEIGRRVAVVFDDEDAHGGYIAIPAPRRPKEWRQVLGGLDKDLPPPCRGRAGGECATADWTEGRASRWAGDKPKIPYRPFQVGAPTRDADNTSRRAGRQRDEALAVARLYAHKHALLAVALGGVDRLGDFGRGG